MVTQRVGSRARIVPILSGGKAELPEASNGELEVGGGRAPRDRRQALRQGQQVRAAACN